MADAKFTALGMSHSGKTCYILGMYYNMCTGINGFKLFTNGTTASKLEDWMDNLDDESLHMDRFPAGTTSNFNTNYSFLLKYQSTSILSFDWYDYAGGLLRSKDENSKTYQEVVNSIKTSTCLYIFIDGELLSADTQEKRIKNVQRKCARSIGHFLTDYANENGKFPPIVFIITKADLCSNVSGNDIEEILRLNFSDLFNGGTDFLAVTQVTLGENIQDDNYTGEVDPKNVHLPFFLGIYQEFLMAVKSREYELNQSNNQMKTSIKSYSNTIDKENSRWFFTNYERINSYRNKIAKLESDINANKLQISELKKYLRVLREEIVAKQNYIACFESGRETRFSDISFFKFE